MNERTTDALFWAVIFNFSIFNNTKNEAILIRGLIRNVN